MNWIEQRIERTTEYIDHIMKNALKIIESFIWLAWLSFWLMVFSPFHETSNVHNPYHDYVSHNTHDHRL